ncbi:hypothetical protein QVA66_02215 [Staphylococcus chromogenes]|nr:hypothetical protein [Staphylococcus chromogenes]
MKLSVEGARKATCAFSAGFLWLFYLTLLLITLFLSNTAISTHIVLIVAGIFFWLSLVMVTRYFWPQHRFKMLFVVAINTLGLTYFYIFCNESVRGMAGFTQNSTYYQLSQILMGISLIMLGSVIWQHKKTPKAVSALLIVHGILWTARAGISLTGPAPLILILFSRAMTYLAEISFGLSWIWVGVTHFRKSTAPLPPGS